MKKGKMVGGLLLTTVLAVTLAACGGSKKGSNSSSSSTASKKIVAYTTNNKKSIKGGTFRYGEQSASPFKGIFSNELSNDQIDSDVMQFGNESLFKTDKSYRFVNGGAANIKLNQKAKTATITINPKVKWSDGKPLEAMDLYYAYEIIANKATQSQRYTGSLQNIVGLTEYHDGKSKKISGVQMPDGQTGKKVVLHFKQMKPGMKSSGSGFIWEAAEPYHYLKDVPFKDLISSPKIRKHPIFYGPYKMTKLVTGQSAEFVPNKYYYGEKPKMSKITFEIIAPTQAPTAAKSGKYDMLGIGATSYAKVKDSKNVKVIGRNSLSYSYMGFKVGHFDNKTGMNVEDKNAKMNNKNLRLAIAHAMDVKGVVKKLYPDGISKQMSTMIPEAFGDYHDSSLKPYAYNLKQSEKLLDDAGYKKGKNGYRTQPNGKKLVIHYASQAGNSDTELIDKLYMQAWKKIGLDVQFTSGKALDFNTWSDKVMKDSKDIDMFAGAWSMSSEPSQDDLYSNVAPYNLERFNTKKNNQLMAEMNNQKAMNNSYRIGKFNDWQKYMQDEAYVIPTTTTKDLYAVTPRVKGLNLTPGSASWEHVSLTK